MNAVINDVDTKLTYTSLRDVKLLNIFEVSETEWSFRGNRRV